MSYWNFRSSASAQANMIVSRDHPDSDEWSRWLLNLRHGGDPSFAQALRTELEGYADRVLDGAKLKTDMTLADIGTGEGLIAFSAINRVGPSLHVVLTDISAPMLRHAEALASERGVRQQCSFVECAADKLTGIPDTSVDVVTTRAVLAYVANKEVALREFHRILKPGGRISLAEPIMQDDAFAACALKRMIDERGTESPGEPFLPLLHRWKAAQFPDTQEKITASPIANFSERTLFESIRVSGFTQIHLELHIDLLPSTIPSWKVFLESSPHPWAPPLSTILADVFTPEERQTFEKTMRPLVESGQALTTRRTAYFNAVKPAT
jgi:arsenite methyltransferase